ncbi:AraC family transcriptional regulator [Pseudonocardia sp. CA-142604]|uniref:helix-turn-helix transcriptional regulator n=1 Tax=Pseudonocardia sp. CA-142604 TaxID=3240024 RepID=UPI003D8DF7F8
MQIFDFCGEELEEVAGEFLLSRIAPTCPDFRGRVAFQELGEAGALCRSHWGGPLRIFRTDRMAARASADNLMLFCVQVAGESSHHQHDRSARLAAGTGVLKETRSAYERRSSAETRSLTLRFPRELLPLRTTEITEGCARGMDPAAPAMRVLSGYLGRLFEVAEDLTAPQRLDAGCAAIDLLAMVLRDVTPSVPSGDGPGEVLLEMMRMHVQENLADPGLRVAELARRHHVSVRHAHTLFERIGTTPGAYLREQRLLEARVMLSDPRYAHLGMRDIAAAVGIVNLRTFERAFRRQYGMKPSSWRREHLPTGSAPRP